MLLVGWNLLRVVYLAVFGALAWLRAPTLATGPSMLIGAALAWLVFRVTARSELGGATLGLSLMTGWALFDLTVFPVTRGCGTPLAAAQGRLQVMLTLDALLFAAALVQRGRQLVRSARPQEVK